MADWYGIQTGVISGRVSPATEERARQVKMTYVYQGHIEKIPILEEIPAKSGIPLAGDRLCGRRSDRHRGDAPRGARHRPRQCPRRK